jgi:hypothetical protein
MKALNEYPELLDQKQLSEYLNKSTATLERDRFKGKGIPYSKIGRNVRYHRDDVTAYLASFKVQTTS